MSEHDPASAAAVYEIAADRYDTAAQPLWDRFGRRTVERVSLRTGQCVLDVCCGAGSSALPSAQAVGADGSVLGIDLADAQLAVARAKAEARGLGNVEFERGDLDSLDGIAGRFDAVICVFGVFFSSDMVAAAARLWSFVAPGGTLAITTWGPRLFEPASSIFWESVGREAPECGQFHPWDRIQEPRELFDLLIAAGVPHPKVELEVGSFPLETPEDWWGIVLGSGFRGTTEKLTADSRESVRRDVLARLAGQGVRRIEASVLYATARRPS